MFTFEELEFMKIVCELEEENRILKGEDFIDKTEFDLYRRYNRCVVLDIPKLLD